MEPKLRLVADVDDYRVVRCLVVGIISEALSQTLPATRQGSVGVDVYRGAI